MKKFLREPLFHFLLLGAALFGVWLWRRDAAGSDAGRIVVTQARISQLATGFTRTWQRPPTQQELTGLVQDFVKEEVCVREATAMGLDRDDTIIRRRLRQKFEFLTEDALEAAPPTDADLTAYMKAHPDSFRAEPLVAFRQVMFDPARRGASLEADVRKALALLNAGGPGVNFAALGDSRLLPQAVELSPESDVARIFGKEFAARVVLLPAGSWTGPIESGFGLHLVQVTEHVEGHMPELADVRAGVAREWGTAQRKKRSEVLFRKLLERYKVVVEPVANEGKPAAEARKSR
jgi:PPIC-type PPIASE domain